jgi:membrane-associated phospholipid phosphatase
MKLSASRPIACLLIGIFTLGIADRVCAGEAAHAFEDAKLYFTAPLRWDGEDWLYFGGSMAAIAVAHHYDDDVRNHFLSKNPQLATDTQSYDWNDAAPAAVVLVGTWAFAALTDDNNGHREAWSMAEATVLSATTVLVAKYAAGRERPNVTADSNAWRAGGDSFPSMHATAAFAIGTVLAESGNDEYRWMRRALGYGLGVATSYQRLNHNQHWLSDTVAGAALGWASARFVLNRRDEREQGMHVFVAPTDGGAMVSVAYYLH